jgi:predicted RNA-binding Zn-ribbon protein involved in translation (DUF1610 family)
MTLKCDAGCGEKFEGVVQVEKVKKDIWKHGFTCPNCGHEYIGYYSNSRIRSEQATTQSLRTKYDAAIVNKNYEKAIRLKKRMGVMEKRTGDDMDKLKARMQE